MCGGGRVDDGRTSSALHTIDEQHAERERSTTTDGKSDYNLDDESDDEQTNHHMGVWRESLNDVASIGN